MTQEKYLKQLAERIKNRRIEMGLTQKELAEKLGTNHTFVTRMETGLQDNRISTLLKVAEALEIEIEKLVKVD